MADRRTIFNGEAGTTWVNDTTTVPLPVYLPALNTCGACLQYHMAIGGWWPIPLHFHCRCTQQPIAIGAPAPHKFVDFRELLGEMSHDQQVAAIGAGNYKLLRAGVVKWDEIVTKYRVRTLRETLAINKVSLKTALAAGVKPHVAEAAYAAVHTPEAELIRQHREMLINQLKQAGVSQELLVDQISRGLAGRVTIAGTRVAPQSMQPMMPNVPLAQELAGELMGWKGREGTEAAGTERAAAGTAGRGGAVPRGSQRGAGAGAGSPADRGEGVDSRRLGRCTRRTLRTRGSPSMSSRRCSWKNENRVKLDLGRADLAHRMNQADVAASETEYRIGGEKAASFNFIRKPKPKNP